MLLTKLTIIETELHFPTPLSTLISRSSNSKFGPSIKLDNEIGKWRSVSIIVNLVSSIQKQSKTELTMNIIKICQE